MKRGQLVLAVLAALAVGRRRVVGGRAGQEGRAEDRDPARGERGEELGARELRLLAGEGEAAATPLIDALQPGSQGGQAVFVEGVNAASGDAESRIAKGTFKPVAWSPASSLWGRLLNFEADKPYTPRRRPRSCARRW